MDASVFIAEGAWVIGDVTLSRDSSVWFNAVLRGDVHSIRIGERTNVQDGAVLHGTFGKYSVIVADDVTIGHRAVVHGCTVQSACLIGMGAVVLDQAEIGAHSIIGAGAVVLEGTRVPSGSLVAGVPARGKRSSSGLRGMWSIKIHTCRYNSILSERRWSYV